jgi:hypothetical protein
MDMPPALCQTPDGFISHFVDKDLKALTERLYGLPGVGVVSYHFCWSVKQSGWRL